MALMTALILVVQIPQVQAWLIGTVTKTLSAQLESRVSIERLRVGFFDKIALGGVYVEDVYGDTLLYGDELVADFSLNPLVLLRDGLVVESLKIARARFNIRQEAGDEFNSLEIVLMRLSPPDTLGKEKKPLRLKLRQISLEDVQFLKDDKTSGRYMLAELARGEILIRDMDLRMQVIAIQSIDLTDPVFTLEDFAVGGEGGDTLAMDEAILPDEAVAEKDTSGAAPRGFALSVQRLCVVNGRLVLHNYKKSALRTTPENILDFKHLNVSDINLDLTAANLAEGAFSAELGHLSLRERSGFVLQRLSANELLVSSERTALHGMTLLTPYSELGDTLVLQYPDYAAFNDFENRVNMTLNIRPSYVALRDIMTFAPLLEKNIFFSSNRDEVLSIKGEVRGRVNNLRGNKLFIELSDGTLLKGSFGSRNLAERNEEILNLQLDTLFTSMRTLRQLIPTFTPPPNFDKLGNLRFNGRFDGFFDNFVAYGNLRTAIGRAELDMNLNLRTGVSRATYSGTLKLEDFDLGKWSGNPDFGYVSFSSEVKDGRGLSLETANAELSAQVKSFGFKQYRYENATLTGKLNKNRFDGDFQIKDENIDLTFKGEINLADSTPIYNFYSTVNKLDLKALNLSKRGISLSGNFDLNLRNRRLADIEGTARAAGLQINNEGEIYDVDEVSFSSTFDALGNKVFAIESNIVTGEIVGIFDIDKVPDLWIQYIYRHYPGFAQRVGIKGKAVNTNSRFTYDIRVSDSQGLLHLVDKKLGTVVDGRIEGFFDGRADSVKMEVGLPYFQYADWGFSDVSVVLGSVKDKGQLDVAVSAVDRNSQPMFGEASLLSLLDGDTINFSLSYNPEDKVVSDKQILDQLYIDGVFALHDSTNFQVRFKQSNFQIGRDKWIINQDNFITFGKRFIDTKDFVLSNGERRVLLEKFQKDGLRLSLFNFDFSIIDQYWDYKALDFGGPMIAQVEIANIFDMKGLRAAVLADSMFINGDDFGAARLEAETKDLKAPLKATLSLKRGAKQLLASGFYNLGEQLPPQGRRQTVKEEASYFDFDVSITDYPLSIGEYFIGNSISDTEGKFSGSISFFGKPKKPEIAGYIESSEGGMTIDYLNTHYTFRDARIDIDNKLFKAKDVVLRDKYGHRATVEGGITHDHLRNFGLNATLRTNRFLALDTPKSLSTPFYGHAIGSGTVRFSGSFTKTDIYVNAAVGDSTRLTIPVSNQREAGELKTVRFVNKHERTDSLVAVRKRDLKGLSLEMDLTVAPEAIMRIVFDEQAGDLIEGRGRGNIRILVPRGENFQMFGNYFIERGNYLFTLYNVINKEFSVKRGGSIQWTGDPFGAKIQLEAEYKDLKASPASFVQEYLRNADPSLRSDASQPTDVSLTLKLRGDLLRPVIDFDIAFPALTGQLQTYAENKIRLLKQDQNELNRQVFGLILIGQFLPDDISIQSAGTDAIYNTVSELVSNQLSLLLTQLFSEALGSSNPLSGTDFNINYSQYQTLNAENSQNPGRGNEFQFRMKQDFLNDRLSLQIGGNVDFGNSTNINPENNGAFVGNDFVLEYVLNKNRTLKLRIYQRLRPDIGGGRRFEVGTGLSYRREFDSFSEFLRSLRKSASKMKD